VPFSRLLAAILAIVHALLLGLAAALEIHFVDVGQGDGVLLVLPDGRGVVYDAGNDDGAMLRYLEASGVTDVALAIASHAHADHIGGLPDVLDAYPPPFVLDNGVIHTTQTFERYLDAVLRSGARLLEPTARTLTLGDVRLHVLPSPQQPDWGHNDNSVGIIVEYGAFRASLTGDAEARLFAWWLETVPERFGAVHVHKASHHGSVNGDTPDALARLRPQVVVVSVGPDNPYGHPDPTILASYRRVGALVYRTDRHGSVVIRAAPDGSYTVTTEVDRPPDRASDGNSTVPAAERGDQCIDINAASALELQAIVHIGPERASEVVERRPFTTLDRLTRVHGIGAARLRDIREQGLVCDD
jgi:competence protein ComEC